MAQRMVIDERAKSHKNKQTAALQNVRWTFWSGYNEGCPLNRWLVKNNYYFTSKSQLDQWFAKNNIPCKPPTHLVLNYGIAHIPDDKMEEFFTHYSESIPFSEDCSTDDLEKGNVRYDISSPGLYFTENRTPIFRMFVDMDLKVQAKMGDETRRKILNILQRAVRRMFESVVPPKTSSSEDYASFLSEMIVLGTPVRVIEESDGTELLKYGYHLIFPNIEVTSETAEIIRRFILYCLLQENDLRSMNWLDIIDGSVYNGSGLRMPHSFKMEFCKCRNPNRNLEDDKVDNGKYDPKCFTCFGTGRFPWHNTYTCQSVYKGDGSIDDCKTALYRRDIKSLLTFATIRTARQTPSSPDPILPVDQKIITDTLKFAYGEEAVAKSIAAHSTKKQTSIPGEDGSYSSTCCTPSKLLRLDPMDERYKILVSAIRGLYPELNPKIGQINYYENVITDSDGNEVSKGIPHTYLAREENGACLNLDLDGKKTHRSSGTYFVITPNGITQRCFSPKADYSSRTSGKKCSEFESVPRKMFVSTTCKTKVGPNGLAEEVEEVKEFNAYSSNSPLMLRIFPDCIQTDTRAEETWEPLRVSKNGALEDIEDKKIDLGVSFMPSYTHSPSSPMEIDNDSSCSSFTSGYSTRSSKKRSNCIPQKPFVVPYQTFQEQPAYNTLLKMEKLLQSVVTKGPIKTFQDRYSALNVSLRRKTKAGSITISQRLRDQDYADQ